MIVVRTPIPILGGMARWGAWCVSLELERP
jgi:hypothetical protein